MATLSKKAENSNQVEFRKKLTETNVSNAGSTETKKQGKYRMSVLHKCIIVFLVITTISVLYYVIYNESLGSIKSAFITQTNEKEEMSEDELLAAVQRHIMVFETSDPLIATVIDADALVQEQPFYRGVVNGDRVLIFSESRRAIVYSPSQDKLVNVGPVVDSNEALDGEQDTPE